MIDITRNTRSRISAGLSATALVAALTLAGCAGTSGMSFFGSPFSSGSTGVVGPGGTSTGGSGGGIGGGGNDRTAVDPCDESQSRKFVTISMRNEDPDDYIHYFVTFVAYIYDETGEDGYIDGAVCRDDVALYQANGYTIELASGVRRVFGNECIVGPALVYFYENGRFRDATGDLASAIAPAQGEGSPTYDTFFTSAGARIPVPDLILFHNPGTGEGAALKISTNSPNPCDETQQLGDSACLQDAFYYVDQNDLLRGGQLLGAGSARRVANDVQGGACQSGFSVPYSQLAPSGVSAAYGLDYEFFRGGRIEYAFIRDDQDPAIPQLLWRVTDSRGGQAHDFDERAGID